MESRFKNTESDSDSDSFDESGSFDDAEIDGIVTASDQNKLLGDLYIAMFNQTFNTNDLELALDHYKKASALLKQIELPSLYLKCCVKFSRSTLGFFTDPSTQVQSKAYSESIQQFRQSINEKQQRLSQDLPTVFNRRSLYNKKREELEMIDEDFDHKFNS